MFRVRGKTYEFQILESGPGVSFTPQRFVPIDLAIGDDGGTTGVAR